MQYHTGTLFLHTVSGILTFILGYMLFLYLNNYKTDNVNSLVIAIFFL